MTRYEVVVETEPPTTAYCSSGQEVRGYVERKFPFYFWMQSNGTFTKEVPLVVSDELELRGFDENDEHYASVRVRKLS